MIEIKLCLPGQPDRKITLPAGLLTAGAAKDNNLCLNVVGVSQHHCIFDTRNERFQIKDLNSSNGTFCGKMQLPANEFVTIPAGSTITMGELKIILCGELCPQGQMPHPVSVPQGARDTDIVAPHATQVATETGARGHLDMSAKLSAEERDMNRAIIAEQQKESLPDDSVPLLRVSGIPESARQIVQKIKSQVHAELIQRLDLKRMAMNQTSQKDLNEKARGVIQEIFREINVPLPTGVTKEKISKEVEDEALGLGPLETLIAMDSISEIMVNGPEHIYVEHQGKIYRTDMMFADGAQVMSAIERIVSPLGRRIDESSPMVDARLQDGSRVNAIIPPLSLIGPSITIRKFSRNPLKMSDLIDFGSISTEIAEFLDLCVKLRKNIIISGGTGSGKTTLLNVLSCFLPNRERIVTIEDAAELQLHQEHVVRLEARPANIEGKGEISIRDLVRNSLRMRPDRIVIGECRGGEALDMLQAMNTGHDGSLTTIHANSPRDCLARLETLVLMSGFDLPLRAIREQIASAISIVVQISREKDGTRKVTHVSEITKMEGDIITMQDLFLFKQEGWSEDGKILGHHVATGSVPTFTEDIKRSGIPFDISIFTPKTKSGKVGF